MALRACGRSVGVRALVFEGVRKFIESQVTWPPTRDAPRWEIITAFARSNYFPVNEARAVSCGTSCADYSLGSILVPSVSARALGQ